MTRKDLIRRCEARPRPDLRAEFNALPADVRAAFLEVLPELRAEIDRLMGTEASFQEAFAALSPIVERARSSLRGG